MNIPADLPTTGQLQAVIKLCWDAASNAPLPGLPPGVVTGSDPFGNVQVSMVRWQTFLSLLNNLTPNHGVVSGSTRQVIEQKRPREPWRGEDGDE